MCDNVKISLDGFSKKVTKLEAQIPYHEGRGNKEEAEKIRQQIKAIWDKAIEASYDM